MKSSNKSPDRENWGRISNCIAVALEKVRESWFESCLYVLQQGAKKDISEDIKLVNIKLGGKAELALKAFQLYLTSLILEQDNYISKSDGKDFADILYAQVCGTQLMECLQFLKRYNEVEPFGSSQLFRFTSDIASYITNNETPAFAATLLTATLTHYTDLHHFVIAECFGDEKTVSELRKRLKKES